MTLVEILSLSATFCFTWGASPEKSVLCWILLSRVSTETGVTISSALHAGVKERRIKRHPVRRALIKEKVLIIKEF